MMVMDDKDEMMKNPTHLGPNQGKKSRRRRTKKTESSKKPSTSKETPKGKALSKASKIGKSASTKEPVEEPTTEVVVLDQLEQPWFNQMVSTTKDPLRFNDLMATLIDFSKLDWNNPEEDRYPFDLSKHLPLHGHPSHLIGVADYFFNNDLEYLKSFDPERTYTTSIIKTKAARYEIGGIEDTVPMLWSPTKVGVKKLHGYGLLEDIVVKRDDRQFYKFKEAIHLTDSGIVDFIVALSMFTRSLVIKKHVEDLQLGVESCQKKINITPPQ
ncbi:hypothetical protein Tco_1525079 [Tanacetum coccineum]